MKIFSIIIILLLTASQSLAEDTGKSTNLKEYDVEIIIFEDAKASYLTSQTWNQDASIVNHLDKRSVSAINAHSFMPLKPAILKKQYNRIKASPEYKVLFYGAWRQAGLEESKAFEINLNALENTHRVKSKNTLSGKFKLVLSRYLHFYSQLEYKRYSDQHQANKALPDDLSTIEAEDLSPGTNQTEALTAVNNIYPMQNHRRMRSKELHYIDHPLVGILIQINPVERIETINEQ